MHVFNLVVMIILYINYASVRMRKRGTVDPRIGTPLIRNLANKMAR